MKVQGKGYSDPESGWYLKEVMTYFLSHIYCFSNADTTSSEQFTDFIPFFLWPVYCNLSVFQWRPLMKALQSVLEIWTPGMGLYIPIHHTQWIEQKKPFPEG